MTHITKDDKSSIEANLNNYPNIKAIFGWLHKVLNSKSFDLHPLLRILYYYRNLQKAYLRELEKELELIKNVPNLKSLTEDMANYEQFVNEKPVIKVAADYIARGYWVEVIPKGSTPTPDIRVKPSQKSTSELIVEVKHIIDQNMLDIILEDIRENQTPYVVSIKTSPLSLTAQAKNLANVVNKKISCLKGTQAQIKFPVEVTLPYAKASIKLKKNSAIGNTFVIVSGVFESDFGNVQRVISRVLEDAAQQLASYSSTSPCLVVLDIGNPVIEDDEVQDVLFSNPHLFSRSNFTHVIGVRCLPSNQLFFNPQNTYINSTLLANFARGL